MDLFLCLSPTEVTQLPFVLLSREELVDLNLNADVLGQLVDPQLCGQLVQLCLEL